MLKESLYCPTSVVLCTIPYFVGNVIGLLHRFSTVVMCFFKLCLCVFVVRGSNFPNVLFAFYLFEPTHWASPSLSPFWRNNLAAFEILAGLMQILAIKEISRKLFAGGYSLSRYTNAARVSSSLQVLLSWCCISSMERCPFITRSIDSALKLRWHSGTQASLSIVLMGSLQTLCQNESKTTHR